MIMTKSKSRYSLIATEKEPNDLMLELCRAMIEIANEIHSSTGKSQQAIFNDLICELKGDVETC